MNKKMLLEYYITIISTAGNFLFYLQGFEIIRMGSSGSVSLSGFLISFIAITSWLIYGIIMNIRPLIISNIVGLIGVIFTLTCIIFFRC